MKQTLRIPGNLLLLGEYAVLEPGGLGVVMAVKPYVVASWASAPHFCLTGVTPHASDRWHPGAAEKTFIARAAAALFGCLKNRAGVELAALRVALELNSCDFFDGRGNKRGFGSSAAVVVALVTSVAHALSDADPAALQRVDLLQTAVEVHRAAQDGRGSGYDIAASLHGGAGLFCGGALPRFTPLNHSRWPQLFLRSGPAAVSTREAIVRYEELKRRDPALVSRFVDASNRAVEAFARAPDWQSQRTALARAREQAAALGDAIGVPADPQHPDTPHSLAKCLGAGNELIGQFVDPSAGPPLVPEAPAARVQPCAVQHQ
ncbi:MAG: hypothetical protein EA404_13290 [Spirochaetaceae bacterium]|nr:MAG: hypothetical protein EA404_13290 [Spirochaetaceae bacterium]